MGVRSKTLITLLLVGIVVGGYVYGTSNKSLFQGKIFDDPAEETTVDTTALPDLKADLSILPPADGFENILASVTISNAGAGIVAADKPFKYAIYINDAEVFSNTDSYSTMNPNDSFNFEYPIPKSIYNYPDTGKVKFVIDMDNAIEESDEGNNSVEVDYVIK